MTDITQKDQAGLRTAGDTILQDKIRLAVVEKVGDEWLLQFYGEKFHLPKEINTERKIKTFCISVMGFDGVEIIGRC